MPRRQAADKIKALRTTLEVIHAAIKAKRWHQARYVLNRARALLNALPSNETIQEREQLSLLRKEFAAGNTTATANTRDAKHPKSAPATRAGAKKPAAKPRAKKVARPPTRTPDVGNRYINRAALGYTPTDGT